MSLPLKVALGGSSLLLLGAVAMLLYTAAELRDFHTDSLKELDEWKYYEKEAWGEMTVIQRERRSPLTGKAFERRFYREQAGDSDSARFTRMSYGSNQAQCNCGIQPSHCPPGPPGPPGGVGAHGEPGLQGEPGKRGASGVALIATYQQQAPGCIQCEIGPPGLPGVDGFPGEMGPPGQPGEAAYPVAGGLPGMPGPPGDQGRPGDNGMPGGPGIPGQDAVCQIGQPGPVGARGPQGEMGLPGVTPGYVQPGEPGPPGPLGRPGNPGRDGQPGQPGYPGGPGRPGDDAHYCSCPPPTARASEQRAAQPKNTYSRPSNTAARPIPGTTREDQAVESLSREEYRKRVVARLLMKRKLMALQARMHA